MANLSSLANPISGIRSAQTNLFVTGHNMANVNTPGFSRQQVMQQDFGYLGIGSNHFGQNQVGLGTDIVGIRQIRDRFLDAQFRQEIGKANFYDTLYNVGTDIELAMGELTNSSSGRAVTRQLWSSIQELSMNPSGIDARGNFVSSNILYLNTMNATYKRLQEQQNNLNQQVKDMVNQVNQLTNTINELNSMIISAEVSGQSANDFRDRRNLALDELSALIDIDYRENKYGAIDISTNGHQLLANGTVSNVGLRYTSPGSNFVEPVLTPSENILPFDPTYSNARSLFSYNKAPGPNHSHGTLKATIMARGLFSSNFDSLNIDPPVIEDFEDDPNGFKAAMETYRRNEFNSLHTIIPKTMRELDTLFNHKVTMINEHLTQGYDLNGNKGIPVFSLIDADGDYTLGNVVINPLLLSPQGYNLLGLSSTPQIGQDDNKILKDLLDAWNAQTISIDGSSNMNIDDLYNHIITSLATETAKARSMRDTQVSIAGDIDNRRLQQFAVSLDEEMTNMIQFQHAFNAASRMINTIDSMIETLIRGTGRVGL